ncbi:MAG TPA: hypothetical protein VNB90_03270 [Cytophagaceae bacterium]|jgi:hypothetical protein|nr:hypothetical protein [Cytophagaceae bacterium]
MMKRKMNNRFVFLYLLAVTLLLGACKDVFEKDITNQKITIDTPPDGAQSQVYKQLFWWEDLNGASQYRIQIASPSFDNPQSIVDTVITGTNKFYKTLSPGLYQWRIRAENGAYKTQYQTFNLTMLVSSLDKQEVNLTSPANNTFVGAASGGLINFTWDKLTGATKYEINIDTISGNFGTNMILNQETTDHTYAFTLPEGEYKWRVKAKDDSGLETDWTTYYIGYYATAPAVPVMITPSSNSTSATFGWNNVTRAETYTLYIYVNDTVNYTPVTYQITAPTVSKTVNFPTGSTNGDKIYAKVSAVDKAGNASALSNSKNILHP